MEKDSDKLKLVMAQKEVSNLSKSILRRTLEYLERKPFQDFAFGPLIPGLYNNLCA